MQQENTPKWTFITNHGLVLSYIFHNTTSTAREIANYIGVTERTTHKIISDLEDEGYIKRNKIGRRNVYNVELGGGEEKLAGQIIRIGHMGWVMPEHIDESISAVEKTLSDLRNK